MDRLLPGLDQPNHVWSALTRRTALPGVSTAVGRANARCMFSMKRSHCSLRKLSLATGPTDVNCMHALEDGVKLMRALSDVRFVEDVLNAEAEAGGEGRSSR